jgi:hypothetical protein
MTIFCVGVVLVVADSARRCYKTLTGSPIPQEAFGPPETSDDAPPARCC